MTEPRFSILTPVYDPPANVLEAMLRSVRRQTFRDWELCLVDDSSPSPHVGETLLRAEREDDRIRVRRRHENGGIVASSNDAREMASGEFIVLLDHDDELHPEALEIVDEALRSDPEADYLYTDEGKVDVRGQHSGPFFKPDWSPERFRTQMYTCHLSVLRRALVEDVGGFDPEFEGSQDWDLVLKVTEKARSVVHVPRLLYHWRTLETSAAGGGVEAKPWAFEAGQRAVQAHCDRIGLEARAERDEGHPGVYRLAPALRREPAVSVVIPTGAQQREVRYQDKVLVSHCVRSVLESSTYGNFEVIVVADGTVPGEIREELVALGPGRVRVVDDDRPFNFSQRINHGAASSDGEHLLLLNDDVEILTPNWIERLVMYSGHEGIGAVGAKLVLEDGRLQHVGVRFQGGLPGHPYHGFSPDFRGYSNEVLLAQNCLAVTGACMMTPRAAFEDLGGLSTSFPINYNDVDYCLKLREAGLRVVYDPETVLFHFESSSRSSDVEDWEKELLLDRWSHLTDPDPYVNPNLRGGFPRLSSRLAWRRRRMRLPRPPWAAAPRSRA